MPEIVEPTLAYAQQRDREDELQSFRSRFCFPQRSPATAANAPAPLTYFCGNSLGLQPRDAETAIQQELADWRNLAIDGYWHAKQPWMTYPKSMGNSLSKLAGCLEDEVTVMNALTVNLHLLLLTFYRPTQQRYKILIEAGAFPSDQFAVETQVAWYGRSPQQTIIEVAPREGEKLIHEEDLLTAIDREKDSLALVLLGGINYYTGQLFDMATITKAAHKAGALAGFDLAHAIGNAPLSLHDWGADFAVWCSYKYLNGGPGAAGGAFIHERHIKNPSLTRLGGWWGNDDMARFQSDQHNLPTATTLASSADSPGSGTNLSTDTDPRPVTGTNPGPGTSPVASTTPVTNTTPGTGAGSVTSTNPGTGANPGIGTNPATGTSPVTGTGPVAGTSPGAALVTGTSPVTDTSPDTDTNPGTGTSPVTGAGSGTSTNPGAARTFIPKATAEGWSMSTAQVFNMVSLKTSLALFDEAGFDRLRKKSNALTSYLYSLVSETGIQILTPAEPERRGAQLSLFFGDKGKSVQQRLAEAGIVVDYREPGVIRVSPVPLYNSFEDVYRFYHTLRQLS